MTVQAGAIEPLVQLLKDAPGEIAAELAAVVLRNLASGSHASRQAIVDAGGLWPLLSLLATGQEMLVYPMPCKACLLLSETACHSGGCLPRSGIGCPKLGSPACMGVSRS